MNLSEVRDKVESLYSDSPLKTTHLTRVLNWSNHIIEEEGGDQKVIECAVWLHDIGRLFDRDEHHSNVSAKEGERNLRLSFKKFQSQIKIS